MESENTDFKEAMAEHRRTQILMGAAQVFAEKGFHKATTKEIAQTAGVAEGTIYNYFSNKRQLLIALIEVIGTQSLRNIVADHPPQEPAELLKMIMHDRFELAQQRGYLMAPIIAEIFADPDLRQEVYNQIARPIAGHLEQYIQAHTQAGHFRPVNPVIVTRALVAAMMLNFAIKLTGLDARYEDFSVDEIIEELVSLFLEGLMPPAQSDEKR